VFTELKVRGLAVDANRQEQLKVRGLAVDANRQEQLQVRIAGPSRIATMRAPR